MTSQQKVSEKHTGYFINDTLQDIIIIISFLLSNIRHSSPPCTSLHFSCLIHRLPILFRRSSTQRLRVFLFPVRVFHSTILLLQRLRITYSAHCHFKLTTLLAMFVAFVRFIIQVFRFRSRSEMSSIDLSMKLCAILSMDIIASDNVHGLEPYGINGRTH